jgi:RND family efflux transporter MFP subunit
VRKTIVTLILVLVVLAAGLAGAVSLVRMKRKPQVKPIRATVTKVRAPKLQPRKNYRVEIIGYGTARPKVEMEIAPRVGGQVVERTDAFFSGRRARGPGDGRPGQVLFRLDDEPFRLAVDNATQQVEVLQAKLATLAQEEKNLQSTISIQADLVAAELRQLERTEALIDRDVGTRHEADVKRVVVLAAKRTLQDLQNQLRMIGPRRQELQAQLAQARVSLDQAKLDLGYATYTAPVTGRIIDCTLEAGEFVQAGQVRGSMYGTDVMEVAVSIPAGDLQWIPSGELQACKPGSAEPGQAIPARVVWVEPGRTNAAEWAGCVERVEAGVEAQTRTARLVVRVKNPPAGSDKRMLDLNMYCEVHILGRELAEAFLLPRTAILGGEAVYVIEDGRLARREVTIARFTDNQALILPGGGLCAGDRVITGYLPKPVLGMRIEPLDAPQTQSASAPATGS